MKKIALLIFLALQIHLAAQEKSITINGKVYNKTDNTIKLLINDLFKDRIIKTDRLTAEGTFNFKFQQPYPHDNLLMYNDKPFKFYAGPGDSLHIELKNDSIFFYGSNQAFNNELQAFKIRGTFELWSKVNDAQRTLNAAAYKKRIKELQAETDSLLEIYYKEHNSSSQLKQWTQYYYKYRTIFDLMRYKRFNKDSLFPANYYDFLLKSNLFPSEFHSKEISFKDDSFDSNSFMCSQTNEVVNEIALYIGDQTRSSHPEVKNKEKLYELFINTIITQTSGQIREIQLTSLFLELIKHREYRTIKNNIATYFTYVKNKHLRSFLLDELNQTRKYKASKEIRQYLSYYSTDSIIAPIVESVISKNRSMVIYIDFWAPWCGPCLKEMNYTKNLQSIYKEKDVSFVYLCVNTKSDDWESKIEELNIKGQHYLLSDDQYNCLSDLFQIVGIPHYVLIDKNGKIISYDALPPSDKDIKIQINKLLN